MTAALASPLRIGLWGATAVGKTALLATALYGQEPALASLRRADDKPSINQHLLAVYQALLNNRLAPGNIGDQAIINLRGRDERPIELVDVRGRYTLEIGAAGRREAVRECHALLFLAEYNGPTAGDQMAAIEAALVELDDDKPVALALTKCERSLVNEDPQWSRPRNWLEETPLWAVYRRTLRRLADHAWPTSAFGYDPVTGLPAVILGEMGQAIPFRIQPRNVAQPLASVLRALNCL